MTFTTIVTPRSSYALRRARRDDVDALVDLMAADALRAAEFSTEESARAGYRHAFDVIDADPAQLLVAIEDAEGGIVGTMQLTFIPGLSRGGATRMQIEAVRVAEELRGEGIGSKMIDWAVGYARLRGARLVQLTSDARRDDAHRFYERLGFEASHMGFKRYL